MAEELKIIVTADTRNAVAGMKRVTTSSKVAMAAIGAAAVAIGTKAVKAANDFGRAMAEVSTITDDNEKQTAQLTDSVRAMAVAMGVDATETARGLYEVISAGVTDSAERLELLNLATKQSIAALTTQEIAVKTITTVMDAYGLSMEDSEDISDTLFTTIRLGKTRYAELAGTIGRVTAVAAPAGISFQEVGAAMAVLTKELGSTDIASTALKSSIAAMISPSQKMKGVADAVGVSIGLQALQGQGLTGVLDVMAELYQKNTQAVVDLFPNQRALIAMLSLSSKEGQKFAEAMREMEKRTGSNTIAFEKMNKSASRQFEIFNAKLNDTMIDLGEAILPSVIKAMEGLAPVMENIGKQIKDNEESWIAMAEGIGLVTTAAAGLFAALTDVGSKIGEVVGKGIFSLLRTGVTREVGQELGGALDLGAAITPEEIAATRAVVQRRREAMRTIDGGAREAVTINMGATYNQVKDPRDRLTEGAFADKVAS